jgi:hypothetical protein
LSDVSTQTLYAEAILGKDVEEWLKSDTGRYMVAGFEEDEKEAMDALAKVHPWRWKRIIQLQERIRMARKFKSLAAEMIVTGKQALQQLESSE